MNLIEQYIDETDSIPEARLKQWGIHVWAIAGYLPVYGGDVEAVARAYDIPVEAAEAAIRYYKKHKHLIDGRLAMNDDPRPLTGSLAKYVDQTWGAGDARLKPWGVQVWAIIGHMQGGDADVAETARAYDVPATAVEAAPHHSQPCRLRTVPRRMGPMDKGMEHFPAARWDSDPAPADLSRYRPASTGGFS